MLSTLVGIQIIATIICLVAVVILSLSRTSSYSNIMIMASICGFVQNAGYIQELLATNVKEGLIAVRSEYIGGAFEICLITLFMFKYCGHELNGIIKSVLLFESCIIVFGVWTWQWNGMYYTDAQFVSDASIPHMVLGHGWLYYTFAATTICELIACIFIVLVSLLKTRQKHMVLNYFILILVVVMPLVGFIISVTGVVGVFDATPVSAAMSIGLFAISIANNHVFDVADVAGEKILADLDNAIIILNAEDGYEYSNNRAKELFPALKKYRRGESISEHELVSIFDKNRDKHIKIGDHSFDVSINTVTSERKNEYVGQAAILFDVTESKMHMEEMQKLIEDTEESNRTKTRFLTNISREIRTPVNTIMGMSEILQRDYSTSQTNEYIANIRDAGNNIASLINDILDFSKIESGKMELVIDEFDMKKSLSDIINDCKFRCNEKNIKFKNEINPETPRYLAGDIFRIKQILNTLLTNSCNFTDSGEVRLKVNYKHRSDIDIDLICVIEDTGMGIPDEEKNKLFESYARIDHKGAISAEGVGLGLNIAKQLVDLMGGVINYKSETGKGTVFSIIIPVKISGDSNDTVGSFDDADKKEGVYRASFTAPEARILIVDDSSTNLLVAKQLLKETKANITTALSGEKCLELMENEHFDLLMLDHRMPGMDGIETFKKLRSSEGQGKDIPVIMLTANASKESKELYFAEHFTDFLSKPVSAEDIIQMLYKHLPEHLIQVNL